MKTCAKVHVEVNSTKSLDCLKLKCNIYNKQWYNTVNKCRVQCYLIQSLFQSYLPYHLKDSLRSICLKV